MIIKTFLMRRILSSNRHLPLSTSTSHVVPFCKFSVTSSTSSPTFSSSGSIKNLVTKPSPARLFNVLWNDNLHSAIPEKYNLVPKDFIPAALEAISLVTTAASEGDWEALDGLVEPHCIQGLQDQVGKLNEEDRKLIALHPDDAFLSYISNERNCEEGRDIKLVVHFYPGLYTVRGVADEMNQLKKETDEKIQKEIFEGKIKNTSDLKGEFVDFKEKVKELNVARSDLLNKNGTSWCGLVGNYRLVRESLHDQWLVFEVGQADSLEVMTPIGRLVIIQNQVRH